VYQPGADPVPVGLTTDEVNFHHGKVKSRGWNPAPAQQEGHYLLSIDTRQSSLFCVL
jgi:hypothetical protein